MATTTLPPASTQMIEWSPVIAGTIAAGAVSLVLIPFGQALGLSFTNLQSLEVVTPQSVLAFGLWLLWTQLSASIVGGYIAGRTTGYWSATHEGELRDGAHGLLVWALGTVITAAAVGAAAALSTVAAAHGVEEPVTTVSHVAAKQITVIAGFSLAAISIVSAVAAWIMATIGGDHRDRKVDVSAITTFRRR